MGVNNHHQVYLKMLLSFLLSLVSGITIRFSIAQQFEIEPVWNNSTTSCTVEVQNSSENFAIFQGSPYHECNLRIGLSTAHGLVVAIGKRNKEESKQSLVSKS